MSDGVVSYIRSPQDNFQPPRWTPPVPELRSDEFSTPVGGPRSEDSLFPLSSERQFNTEAARSDSFGSPFSECSQWESTSKRPSSHRNSRRSFLSKPVYPLVFRNPISESEVFDSPSRSSISKSTPAESTPPSHWSANSSNLEHKFHRTIMELQRMEASPDPSMSSRREGFRWSNASSYDLGFDGENFDAVENVDIEYLRSPNYLAVDHKCGLCSRLMRQRSPWSSYRIVRGSDMPIAGVLSCSHVFHAECLEQATAKTQIHDPPCPMCSKTLGFSEDSPSVSEPLQVALRSVQRNRGIVISDTSGIKDVDQTHQIECVLRKTQSPPMPQQSGGTTSMKSRFKKRFTFKGKTGKDIFRRSRSSSSNYDPGGCSKSLESARK